MSSVLFRIFPSRWRRAVKARLRRVALRAGYELLRRKGGRGRSGKLGVELIRWGWANEGYAADCGYLLEVARLGCETEGPVLECGSGASTLILSATAGVRGKRVVSLEHLVDWRNLVVDALGHVDAPGADVLHSPLRDYEGFSWYDVPEDLPGSFPLVVCDGPPVSTPGGRFGLVPVLGDRLRKGTIVLMDDMEREEEQQIVEKWEGALEFDKSYGSTGRGRMARLVVRRDPGEDSK